MAASFFSNALGTSNEYRAWFSDKVNITVLAHGNGGDIWCRPGGTSGDYKSVHHIQSEAAQVKVDMDKAELGLP